MRACLANSSIFSVTCPGWKRKRRRSRCRQQHPRGQGRPPRPSEASSSCTKRCALASICRLSRCRAGCSLPPGQRRCTGALRCSCAAQHAPCGCLKGQGRACFTVSSKPCRISRCVGGVAESLGNACAARTSCPSMRCVVAASVQLISAHQLHTEHFWVASNLLHDTVDSNQSTCLMNRRCRAVGNILQPSDTVNTHWHGCSRRGSL